MKGVVRCERNVKAMSAKWKMRAREANVVVGDVKVEKNQISLRE